MDELSATKSNLRDYIILFYYFIFLWFVTSGAYLRGHTFPLHSQYIKCNKVILFTHYKYTHRNIHIYLYHLYILNGEIYRFDEASSYSSPPVYDHPSFSKQVGCSRVLTRELHFQTPPIAFSLVFGLNGLFPHGDLLLPFAINLRRRSRCLCMKYGQLLQLCIKRSNVCPNDIHSDIHIQSVTNQIIHILLYKLWRTFGFAFELIFFIFKTLHTMQPHRDLTEKILMYFLSRKCTNIRISLTLRWQTKISYYNIAVTPVRQQHQHL